ncbi:MAG: ATP-binding protein [Gammaproteobacteria bacterium]
MLTYRLELEPLNHWAQLEHRKPIVIRGARQVGKSTLVKLLAEHQQLALLELNFERTPELAELFQSNDPVKIIDFLQIQFKCSVIPGKTLLFLDEIQATPQILTSLRYFYEEMPQLHVIAAGSLLDFALKNATFSMPVGRLEYMYLGPLSFEGFLLAVEETQLYHFLVHYHLGDDFPSPIHQRLLELLKVYLIIGGMPEAVVTYAQTRDFAAVERVKHSILNTYQDDFNKYAPASSQFRLRQIFNKIAALVGHKLKYSHIIDTEKSTVVAAALEKLCLARVVYLVHHSACNGLPLGAQISEKIFKSLFLDVGLLSTNLGLNFLDLRSIQELTLVNSGSVAEQFVGQHLLFSHPPYVEPKLYYWTREKKSAAAEIDYVMSQGLHIIPVEVKAGKTGSLKSLHYFLQEKHFKLGVKLNTQLPSLSFERNKLIHDGVIEYQLLSLPLYFVGQLSRLLEESCH